MSAIARAWVSQYYVWGEANTPQDLVKLGAIVYKLSSPLG